MHLTPLFIQEPFKLLLCAKNLKNRFVFNLLITSVFIGIFTINIAHAAGSSSADDSSKNSQHSSGYYEAVKLIKAENFDEALILLQTLIEKDPNDADIHNYLGFSFRKIGDFDKSSYHYQKALSIDPKHLGALEYQGELYIALGKVEKAKENLVKIDDICFTQCKELRELRNSINKALN